MLMGSGARNDEGDADQEKYDWETRGIERMEEEKRVTPHRVEVICIGSGDEVQDGNGRRGE